jgi:sterol desaturase/sphingolipid hydroxylase (fatty acid hydroxylase superfamily)
MVPLVLFNQLIVWPLVSLLIIWPIWQQREAESGISSWSWIAQLGTLVSLMVVSDQLWYWAHRMLHLPMFWSWAHRDHHVAPQAALSATFVHPLEYSLFCLAMQLPFALAGFPMLIHAMPLGWGMFTGSGAHSGYSGVLANGDEHNAHHLVTDVNFGLLMIADRMWGTHWRPESGLSLSQLNLKLKKSSITKEIEDEFGDGIVAGTKNE